MSSFEDTKGEKLIIEDNVLRQSLTSKGFEQVKKFSWQRCAQETAAVYQRLMKK